MKRHTILYRRKTPTAAERRQRLAVGVSRRNRKSHLSNKPRSGDSKSTSILALEKKLRPELNPMLSKKQFVLLLKSLCPMMLLFISDVGLY